MQVSLRLVSLAWVSLLALGLFGSAASSLAQPASCPQFFPGGQAPALTNPRLAQRTTLLCNDAYRSRLRHDPRTDLVGRAAHGGDRRGGTRHRSRKPVPCRAAVAA